jgi:hypothetical protein
MVTFGGLFTRQKYGGPDSCGRVDCCGLAERRRQRPVSRIDPVPGSFAAEAPGYLSLGEIRRRPKGSGEILRRLPSHSLLGC